MGYFQTKPMTQAILEQKQELPFELQSLAKAVNYQQWIFSSVKPYLGKRILELGAGIGNLSNWLPVRERLILTETEPAFVKILENNLKHPASERDRIAVRSFDLAKDDIEYFVSENVDTIVSFNVLEHIQDDFHALSRLSEILKRSKATGPKRLITFVPAHQWAYGSIDKTLGHYRRYSRGYARKLCKRVAPEAKFSGRYFNVAGLAGWFVQSRILHTELVGNSSMDLFEKLCPIIRPVDEVLHKVFQLPLGNSYVFVMEWS